MPRRATSLTGHSRATAVFVVCCVVAAHVATMTSVGQVPTAPQADFDLVTPVIRDGVLVREAMPRRGVRQLVTTR